jgi:hypothetical protein
MSATADSSCGELSEALQRNAKHEARLSSISDLLPIWSNMRTEIILPRLRDQNDIGDARRTFFAKDAN